jgi:hypothetical protein
MRLEIGWVEAGAAVVVLILSIVGSHVSGRIQAQQNTDMIAVMQGQIDKMGDHEGRLTTLEAEVRSLQGMEDSLGKIADNIESIKIYSARIDERLNALEKRGP